MKPRMHGAWYGYVLRFFANAVIMLFSLSCLFPMIWVLNSSLKTSNDFLFNIAAPAVPAYWDNYVKVLSKSDLLRSFLFSGALGMGNVVLVVVFAFIVGYFISRYDFRFKKALYMLFVSGMVIPVLALLIPVFIQFKYLGMLNSPFTLLITYTAFSMPFSVILMESYIKGLPCEMDEAAYMEGCSTIQMLAHVIFPMCVPILSILVITSFMSAWNEFPFGLVLVSSKDMRTVSLAIRMFNQEHTKNYTLYMAALFLTIMPVLVVYILFSRRIMEGMTIGAVKG